MLQKIELPKSLGNGANFVRQPIRLQQNIPNEKSSILIGWIAIFCTISQSFGQFVKFVKIYNLIKSHYFNFTMYCIFQKEKVDKCYEIFQMHLTFTSLYI